MKVYKRTPPKCLHLFAFLISLHACNSGPDIPAEASHSQIDTLIQVHIINERTIMVSFGAEAISAINTEKGIVVIDAGISTGLTSVFKRKIENEFQNSPFTLVINTHADPDHCRGNTVFPTAEIVGHENGPEEMEQYWKNPERAGNSLRTIAEEYEVKLKDCPPHSEEWCHNFTQKTRYQSAYTDAEKGIPIRKPGILFADSLSIDMGNITFEMKYFGRCHSKSDILIYIPELHILFTGDLIFPYGRPGIRDKTMTDKKLWHNAVAWTETRMPGIETIIGGHGQLLSIDDLNAFNKSILEK